MCLAFTALRNTVDISIQAFINEWWGEYNTKVKINLVDVVHTARQ